ncbi:tail fiber domain-containing protein [Erwinia billingiae]|uniref:tail fiber domain-containing protein n=1 Tax=Erwinia billingiae TaxID=182337 RepID=UPI0022469BCD|nr:tail fiber domain-containing protein [Erwinia billingiae]
MPAGTIALTNNSTTVTGTGTSFTTELKVNDFVVAVVGGVAYTLGVATIASNTSLTLIQKYDGPTTSGLTWNPVPFGTMSAITAQLAAQVTYAIRGLNLDKNNWQQVYTGTGNITVNLPDGSSYTGPAWNGIATSIANKADLVSGAVPVTQGGTGQKTLSGVMTWLGLGDAAFKNTGTASGTLAAGNDTRLDTVNGKTGGTISSAISVNGVVNVSSNLNVGTNSAPSSQVMAASTNNSELNRAGGLFNSIIYTGASNRAQANFYMATTGSVRVAKIDVYADGSGGKSFQFYQDSGNGTCSGSWNGGSDERHKTNITLVPNALQATLSFRGCTYDKKDGGREVGLIAQDVEKFCPVAVSTSGDRTFEDGTVIKDFKNLNLAGVAAAYHTESIKALFSLVELAIVDPDRALKSIDAIKAALAAEEASS